LIGFVVIDRSLQVSFLGTGDLFSNGWGHLWVAAFFVQMTGPVGQAELGKVTTQRRGRNPVEPALSTYGQICAHS
jgi:multisubunit Na+/H+ antiporter MnhG subunit